MFSRRSAFSREPNALTRALARVKRPVLDLTVSNPTVAGLPYDAERLLAALARPEALTYDPRPFGLPSAREVVRAELRADGIEVSHERVVLTASTSEAYSVAFQLLCDPGDAVLVPAPSYPLLEHLAALAGVRLVPYPLAYDGAWHVDLDAVARARVPRTRAVVVVSPNNPTGNYLARGELEGLAEQGLPIISDEVFARYPLCEDAKRVRSALDTQRVPVIALGGLAKLAALPQVKLGWMLLGGPAPWVDEALARLELILDAYLSLATPVQHALPEILAATRTTTEAIRSRLRENLKLLDGALAGSPASRLHVEGGWYAVVRLPRTRREEEWVVGLLEEAGVLVQPGWFFDFPDEAFVVVSLLTPSEVLVPGARALGAYASHWTSVR